MMGLLGLEEGPPSLNTLGAPSSIAPAQPEERLLLFAVDNGDASRNEDVVGFPGHSRLEVQCKLVQLLAAGNSEDETVTGTVVRQRVGVLTLAERVPHTRGTCPVFATAFLA